MDRCNGNLRPISGGRFPIPLSPARSGYARWLDLPRDMASVAFTSPKMAAAFFRYLRFASLTIVTSVAVSALFAQDAVETSREAAPEESPAKKSSADKNPDQSHPGRSLEETMRPEEFKAAGLDKLSEDELQHLDAWLQGYRQATQKKATEQAQEKAQEEIKKATEKATEDANRNAASARTKLDSLVSRVDGNIDGLRGHTLIRLEDGTVWKQANTDDHFRAQITDHPVAVVMHTTFGYKMRIEGMPEFYVDPVVRP